jgi:hypothetical protein
VSNVQNWLVDWKSWFDELENNDEDLLELENDDDSENLLDEIIDDKCDNEIITHVLSQFKKKHVVDAFSYYDILIFNEKHSRFLRHRAKIVQLIKID